jgi:nicotinamide-nucleotide adenylyltransferase
MLLAAAQGTSGLAVLATNAARFADQAEALREAYPGIGFDFVAGFDTLVRIFDPRYYDDMESTLAAFFAQHRLIVTNRGEATLAAVRDFAADARIEQYREQILVHELDQHPASLSSTQARESAGRGEAPPAVEPAVARYIREHGLYASGDA